MLQHDYVALAEVTAGLPTTSAKIRALARAGVPRADIARFLDIRYQHVRNVLVQPAPKAELEIKAENEGLDSPPADPELSLESLRGNLEVSSDGTLELPANFLRAAEMEPGDTVLARVVDGELRISGYAATFRRAQWIAERFHQPGKSEVDDFIAERRALGARGE